MGTHVFVLLPVLVSLWPRRDHVNSIDFQFVINARMIERNVVFAPMVPRICSHVHHRFLVGDLEVP